MSVINLFVAARNSLSEWRRRHAAYAELMSLDDRSLADIGIHRSQIAALVDGAQGPRPAVEAEPAGAFVAPRHVRPVGADRWFQPF